MHIRWQPVSTTARIICGFFGVVGVLVAILFLFNLDVLASGPPAAIWYLGLGGLGFIAFLFAAIAGKFPDSIAPGSKRNE